MGDWSSWCSPCVNGGDAGSKRRDQKMEIRADEKLEEGAVCVLAEEAVLSSLPRRMKDER